MAITRNRTAEYMNATPSEVKIIDGVAVKYMDILVHTFRIGDVDDPEIYAAEPIWEWQQTDAGRFVMEHAVDKPYWIQHRDHSSYHLLYRIMARLSEQNEVFWRLKYVDTKN
jgi:hypothetical protein